MHRKDNADAFPAAVSPERDRSADLGLLLMAFIWGVNFPVIKAALAEIPPLAFNALRFPFAALTVFLILRSRGILPWPHRQDLLKVIWLGIHGNLVYQAFFIFGVDSTLAGNASVLLATIPIWTLILATLKGHENHGWWVWLGVGGTLLGMVFVVLGGRTSLGFGGSTIKGDLLMVGAAMTWASYTVASRDLVRKYGSTPVAAWTLWVGTLGLVLLGLPSLLELDTAQVSPGSWAAVLYAGIFAIGLAYVLWNRGIKAIGSSRTATFQNLTPVVALLVAWLWLNETPTGLQIGGAAVILGGISLARLSRGGGR